jgi:regulator of protease activity HflC (stomatin/prohibitin superfamily)
MFPFIISIILVVVALVAIVIAFRTSEAVAGIIGAVALVLAVVAFLFSTVFTQDRGEAKVIVNFDGTIAGEKLDTGFGWKAPWQKTVNFDVFQQEVLFAGEGNEAPSYSGGEVNGAEVTVAVARGAQAFVDLQVVYSLDPKSIQDVYNNQRDQERFTRQIIQPNILSSMRDVPSAYTPVEFRGEKRGEATDSLLKTMNKKLEKYGVTVSSVNLQDIRFTKEVEQSIKDVEVAQQTEEKAKASLRATEVSAQAQVVEAQAKADANRLLNESLTPEILQSRYLDALKEGTVYVVPEGSTPLIQTR